MIEDLRLTDTKGRGERLEESQNIGILSEEKINSESLDLYCKNLRSLICI